MASLNQIAQNTRLGMNEGPIAPVNLTPEQTARAAGTMKTLHGTAPPAGTPQLAAVAGARRSRSTEPRATVYNTLGQRLSALESIKKTVSDHYAQYDASKRRLAMDQATALSEKTRMEEERKTEQQRQQEQETAMLKEQQAKTMQETEAQRTRRSETAAQEQRRAAQAQETRIAERQRLAAEQQRQVAAALEARLAENRAAVDAEAARSMAAQVERQNQLTEQQERIDAERALQQNEQQGISKAEQRRAQELEKVPGRTYWEGQIRAAQDRYMKTIGQYNPNALIAYNEGLAQTVAGEGRYYVTIPDFPRELAPADDPTYRMPGGLPNLEDYLVDYDKSFSGGVHPAYTRVFWQLRPEDRPGYLAAGVEDDGSYSAQKQRAYLDNVLRFELDPGKPLIKQPTPNTDWSSPTPTPGPTLIPPENTGSYSHDLSNQKYLRDNPDIAGSGMSPWEHYSRYGRREGRTWPRVSPVQPATQTGGLSPNPQAPAPPASGGTPNPQAQAPHGSPNPQAPAQPVPGYVEPQAPAAGGSYNQAVVRYLQDNPDVARAGMDAWQHYTIYGRNEGRTWPGETQPALTPPGTGGGEAPPNPPAPPPNPPPENSTALTFTAARSRYLQDNPDVARAGMDPWQHYTIYGRGEGRAWPGEEEPVAISAY
jgi:hypothetical protein